MRGGGWNQGPICRKRGEKTQARPPGRNSQGGVRSSHGALGEAQSGPSDHKAATQEVNSILRVLEARLSEGPASVCEGTEGSTSCQGGKSNAKDESAGKSVQAGEREAWAPFFFFFLFNLLK